MPPPCVPKDDHVFKDVTTTRSETCSAVLSVYDCESEQLDVDSINIVLQCGKIARIFIVTFPNLEI